MRDDVAFDEINALIEPLWCGVSIGGCNKPKAVTAAGQRSRLMYVTPAGTSSLAALDRVFVALARVQPKARVQDMVTVSASEMQKSMDSTGRVEIAKLLNGNPALKLHVVGHTDNQGGLDSNFALAKARAQAVSSALAQTYAIAATRLTANGVSSLAPVASNSDEAGRAKNRRVELVPF